MEYIVQTIFITFLNFLGACIRWFLGTIWRTIFNKEKYTFKQYLNGPKELTLDNLEEYDQFDDYDSSKNVIVGGVFFIASVLIMIKIFI